MQIFGFILKFGFPITPFVASKTMVSVFLSQISGTESRACRATPQPSSLPCRASVPWELEVRHFPSQAHRFWSTCSRAVKRNNVRLGTYLPDPRLL